MEQDIMTPSAFQSYIKSILRKASMRWPPINRVRTNARMSRGMYKCAVCNTIVPATIIDEKKKKRVKNVVVDHISPIVPISGFDSWDNVIRRLFCSESNLQLLCKECHDRKTADERLERKQ